MSKAATYQDLITYMNRVEPGNGRSISWQHNRICTMTNEVLRALGQGTFIELAPQGMEIIWKNRPKRGGFRGALAEFQVNRPGERPQLITVEVPA